MADRAELSEEDRQALERIAANQEEDAIERGLAAARERLGMEVAYITAIDSETRRVSELAGDPGALGIRIGSEGALEDTYCVRMLRGEIPNVVPDTSQEPAVQGLAASDKVGAYVGVPITLADGSVHGTLCSASSEPLSNLGEEELAFMRVLADIVARRIDRSHELTKA